MAEIFNHEPIFPFQMKSFRPIFMLVVTVSGASTAGTDRNRFEFKTWASHCLENVPDKKKICENDSTCKPPTQCEKDGKLIKEISVDFPNIVYSEFGRFLVAKNCDLKSAFEMFEKWVVTFTL